MGPTLRDRSAGEAWGMSTGVQAAGLCKETLGMTLSLSSALFTGSGELRSLLGVGTLA